MECFQCSQEVRNGPGKAVKLPNHHCIKTTFVGISHKAVELRSGLFRTGDPHVDVVTDNLPTATMDVVSQLAQLHFRILPASCRRDACIHCNPLLYCIGCWKFVARYCSGNCSGSWYIPTRLHTPRHNLGLSGCHSKLFLFIEVLDFVGGADETRTRDLLRDRQAF